ncbi:hypothetical protein CVT24_004768 [Panaeolus cyanescens]|uniref:Vps72/YL1 C-terminal domain-containing protein n=1 Tax=Panaeolus cyanescens TaxID=181874 RepID=A0A409V9V1_9AGAR|nr:hypothetical protein CVT24_004768 [Panaeolus cyanescens]
MKIVPPRRAVAAAVAPVKRTNVEAGRPFEFDDAWFKSLAAQLSYLHSPRPFKNPNYTKNINRRAKNLKAVLGQERERERAEREARRLEREEKLKQEAENAEGRDKMNVDSATTVNMDEEEEAPTYTTIEAPPSVLPHRHLCDITGLEAPYTHPATGLRYHDKSVYEIVKGLNPSMAKDYLSGLFCRALLTCNTF